MAIFVLPDQIIVSTTVIASTFLQIVNLAGRAMVILAQAYHVIMTKTAFRTTALAEFALGRLTVKTVYIAHNAKPVVHAAPVTCV
jgi:hypothetical protein